jgi:hypothetical protein
MPKAYIFRCTNTTEDECFERKLFGVVLSIISLFVLLVSISLRNIGF